MKDQHSAARRLAALLGLVGLLNLLPLGMVPLREDLPSWTFLVVWLSVVQWALAIYLWQTADRSSLWMVTLWCTVATIAYTAMFAWAIRAGDDNAMLIKYQLAEYLEGGRLAAWSFLMLTLNGCWSYAGGQSAIRWRRRAG